MKTAFKPSMFDSIKGALQQQDQVGGDFQNLFRMKKGSTYLGRLLPVIDDPASTFFRYINVGWESLATGQYVQYLSPQTFQEVDPILQDRYKLFKGSAADQERAKIIKRTERHIVNFYVVDDPVNPENNGTVKILSYGKQLGEIINEAIDGEDAEEFGEKIFDLSPAGCNLRIKVDDQGGYANYTKSKFLSPSDLNLSESDIERIYGEVHPLKTFFPTKSHSEILSLYDEHFLVNDNEEANLPEAKSSNSGPPSPKPTVDRVSPVRDESDDSDESDDAKINELLAGLDD